MLFIWVSCIFTNTSTATTYYSIANGNWTSTSIWSTTPGGPSCGCSPISSDNINIYHTVTLNKNLTNQGSSLNGITGVLSIIAPGQLLGGSTYNIDIRSTGTFINCGTVTCDDLTFSNGSIITVCSTATLTINGDFFNKNNSTNVTINGTMTVGGSYTNGNGASVGGTGTINILDGPVVNPGSTFGCSGMDPCGGTFPCTVAYPCNFSLPTKIGYFQLRKNGNRVDVEWSTGSEFNNDYFDIERSLDGQNFARIIRVKGAGTSSSGHQYHTIDSFPASGLNYYRLKQVNFDGSFDYSEILTETMQLSVSVSLFPNPVNDNRAQLRITAPDKCSLSLEIRDYSGRNTYLKKEYQYDATHTTFTIDEMFSIPNGVYIAAVKTDQYVYNEMLIIAR